MGIISNMFGLSSDAHKKEGNGLFIIYLKSGHILEIEGKATIQRSKRDINTIQIISEKGDYEFHVNEISASFNNWKNGE